MKYTTHYTGTAKKNMAKATRDVLEYMGDNTEFTINSIAKILKGYYQTKKPKVFDSIRFILSFAGIEGMYPCLAITKMAYKKYQMEK